MQQPSLMLTVHLSITYKMICFGGLLTLCFSFCLTLVGWMILIHNVLPATLDDNVCSVVVSLYCILVFPDCWAAHCVGLWCMHAHCVGLWCMHAHCVGLWCMHACILWDDVKLFLFASCWCCACSTLEIFSVMLWMNLLFCCYIAVAIVYPLQLQIRQCK